MTILVTQFDAAEVFGHQQGFNGLSVGVLRSFIECTFFNPDMAKVLRQRTNHVREKVQLPDCFTHEAVFSVEYGSCLLADLLADPQKSPAAMGCRNPVSFPAVIDLSRVFAAAMVPSACNRASACASV